MKNFLGICLTATLLTTTACSSSAQHAALSDKSDEKIASYRNRAGHDRPVIVVIGENRGTELTDFLIPYSVLQQSGVATVIAVATRSGPLQMNPTLRIQPQATVDQFDARFPEGADYVIVPAVTHPDDPALRAWIRAQDDKGSTIVSICDGALVVANSGLMKGHRATAHWATEDQRGTSYPDTTWLKNTRYVADGQIVSSAGISAAIPISVALVEAIAGKDRAAALAHDLGLTDWSAKHDSDRFQLSHSTNLMAFATTYGTNHWFHGVEKIGVPVAPGVDDIALALTADSYSRTGRSHAYAVASSAEPILTRHGLTLLPDAVAGSAGTIDRVLPPFDGTPPVQALDKLLAGIADDYGDTTAYAVSLEFEYPGYRRQ